MIEVECVVMNKTYFRCSACFAPLFREDDNEAAQWNYCPICGEPLYPEE